MVSRDRVFSAKSMCTGPVWTSETCFPSQNSITWLYHYGKRLKVLLQCSHLEMEHTGLALVLWKSITTQPDHYVFLLSEWGVIHHFPGSEVIWDTQQWQSFLYNLNISSMNQNAKLLWHSCWFHKSFHGKHLYLDHQMKQNKFRLRW